MVYTSTPTGDGAAAEGAAHDAPPIIVQFPEDFSLGEATVAGSPMQPAHWQGPATGAVEVPAGAQIALTLAPEAADALHVLTTLPEGVLAMVSFGEWFGDEEAKRLPDLRSVMALQLMDCPLTDEGFEAVGRAFAPQQVYASLPRVTSVAPMTDWPLLYVALRLPLVEDLGPLSQHALMMLDVEAPRAGDYSPVIGPTLLYLDVKVGDGLPDGRLPGLEACLGLERLTLSGGGSVADEVLAALAALPRFHVLSLAGPSVSASGLGRLAASPSLTEIFASSTDFDDACLMALAGAPALATLRVPDASVTARGVKALELLPALVKVSVPASAVDDEAIAVLASLPGLKSIWAKGADDDILARIRQAKPDLEINGVLLSEKAIERLRRAKAAG